MEHDLDPEHHFACGLDVWPTAALGGGAALGAQTLGDGAALGHGPGPCAQKDEAGPVAVWPGV
jgi:hypothetical protein